MSTIPLLEKLKTNSKSSDRGKMLSALKSKLPLSPKQDQNELKSSPSIEMAPLSQTTITESDFYKLLENRDEEKVKIEKEMHYVEDLYTQAEYFVDFQANYISEIEKSLEEVEKNSKSTAAALKKANSNSDCIQKFLYSVISVQMITIIVLLVLIWLF
jgi:hypothetical protein